MPPTRGCSHLTTVGTAVLTATVANGEPAIGSPSRLTSTVYVPRRGSACATMYEPSPRSATAGAASSGGAVSTWPTCLPPSGPGSCHATRTSNCSPPLRARLPYVSRATIVKTAGWPSRAYVTPGPPMTHFDGAAPCDIRKSDVPFARLPSADAGSSSACSSAKTSCPSVSATRIDLFGGSREPSASISPVATWTCE